MCSPLPPPPPHAWRDVIVTDRDEVTIGNERRLLFATAGGWEGAVAPQWSRAESWCGCRGAKPPEALRNLHFTAFLSEPFWNWNGNICLWCKVCLIVNWYIKDGSLFMVWVGQKKRYVRYTLFYKKLRAGPSTESFLVSGDMEYSKFLNSVLTIFLNRTTSKRKHGFIVKNK